MGETPKSRSCWNQLTTLWGQASKSVAGSEQFVRNLINDVTPIQEPPKYEEYLWQKEFRAKLEQPDNGREIITLHSMQTRQGKSQFTQRLEWECNQRREGSALIIDIAPARDLINTIKDFRHSLELLVVEIPKAKGEEKFLEEAFSMLENIKNGMCFAGKFYTEVV